MNFKEYCEKEIYLHWKDDADFSSDFAEDFQTDYIPNLYYEMFEEQNKLFVLKNNPGIVLDSQHRDYIRKIMTKKLLRAFLSYFLPVIKRI